MKLRELLTITFTSFLLLLSVLLVASSSNIYGTPPTPTGYTLTDIYNLVHNNILATNHNLYPSSSPNTTSSYSISELYAELVNLIDKGDIDSDVTYLSVTGDYDNAGRNHVAIIPPSLNPIGTPGTAVGYSLDDIYNLVVNNTTATAGAHDNRPGKLAPSQHTISEIYEALSKLINPAHVRRGITYLGVQGISDCLSNKSGFNAGVGSVEDPYKVCSWTQLNRVRNHLTSNYVLTANLSSANFDYSGLGDNWIPLGTSTINKFSANFDGHGFKISDLVIDRSEVGDLGLFGFTDGNIADLGLINVNISGLKTSGGLAGTQMGGIISDSYVTGRVIVKEGEAGGLIGQSLAGIISGSYSEAAVSGNINIGGLVGDSKAKIDSSYSTSDVTAVDFVGGLVGRQQRGQILNSYSKSVVSSSGPQGRAGGLVGSNLGGLISKSFSSGEVKGLLEVGGLAGYNQSGVINSSYSTANVTGTVESLGGLVGKSDAGTINNSYSRGDVVSVKASGVGGLVGKLTNGGSINNSYSLSHVDSPQVVQSSKPSVGGLVGQDLEGGVYSQSFYSSDLSGQSVSAGGIAKTSDQLKSIATFSGGSWNITTTIRNINGNYPYLGWQNGDGEYTWFLFAI